MLESSENLVRLEVEGTLQEFSKLSLRYKQIEKKNKIGTARTLVLPAVRRARKIDELYKSNNPTAGNGSLSDV